MKPLIQKDNRFGFWTAISYVGGKTGLWLCRCDCGKEAHVRGYCLRKGTSTSCGCKFGNFGEKCKKLGISTKEVNRDDVAIRCKFSLYRSNAKTRGIAFDLSFELFKQLVTYNCYFCGLLPAMKVVDTTDNTKFTLVNGIDRIDSNLGYTVNNCVPCCKLCNLMKNALPTEDFLNHVDRIHSHNNP